MSHEFQRELLAEPPPLTRAQVIGEWLCLEYDVATETFDRAVCTGSRHGVAVPMSGIEQGLICRNALKQRRRVMAIAVELGLDVADMTDARELVDHSGLNSFEEEIQALDRSRARLHRFDLDHVEWLALAERMEP